MSGCSTGKSGLIFLRQTKNQSQANDFSFGAE
jgi:hypothetical protein